MSDPGIQVIKHIVITTLVVTVLIGIAFYFFYGIEMAIISVFSAILVFTIIHIVLFYFWLTKKSE